MYCSRIVRARERYFISYLTKYVSIRTHNTINHTNHRSCAILYVSAAILTTYRPALRAFYNKTIATFELTRREYRNIIKIKYSLILIVIIHPNPLISPIEISHNERTISKE